MAKSEFHPSDEQVDAMQAIFDLGDAIGPKGLSIGDLVEIIRVAVDDGHDHLVIALTMAATAVQVANGSVSLPGR